MFHERPGITANYSRLNLICIRPDDTQLWMINICDISTSCAQQTSK